MFLDKIVQTPSVTETKDGRYLITGIPAQSVVRFTQKNFGTVKFLLALGEVVSETLDHRMISVCVDPFFIPEVAYIFDGSISQHYGGSRLRALKDMLYENTWFGSTRVPVPSKFDMSIFNGNVIKNGLKPLPAQLEFIRDTYWQKKIAYKLNGYLLSLPPGCGKSLTSLFLAAGMHKTKLVIIAPLSTVKNVWVTEVEKAFVKPMKIVTSLDRRPVTASDEVVIINYEAIEAYTPGLVKYFSGDDTMMIVDECHNFKDINSKRTRALVTLAKQTQCHDILMMSGTPVKAFGAEALPLLCLLDNFYTKSVEDKLNQLRHYSKIMNSLMCHRLGFMMFRKTKDDVFSLPEKYELDLLVKVDQGMRYTLPKVREVMEKYSKARMDFYNKHKGEYTRAYERGIEWFQANVTNTPGFDKKAFVEYLDNINTLRNNQYNYTLAPLAHASRSYEDEVIVPTLPNDIKRDFKDARSVVKYVELKVLGETLGNVLGNLRAEMTSDLLVEGSVKTIIERAQKKTILFSSYKDTIDVATSVCKEWGFNPVTIDGSNSNQAKELVAKFKTDPHLNPLIASLQVMSTGHTINEANTVIFLNVPFRSVDYDQASDRCYRIGQDTEVYVYKLILDTGDVPNLSTRMQDIVKWSREQFNEIMGESDESEIAAVGQRMGLSSGVNAGGQSIFDTIKSFIGN